MDTAAIPDFDDDEPKKPAYKRAPSEQRPPVTPTVADVYHILEDQKKGTYAVLLPIKVREKRPFQENWSKIPYTDTLGSKHQQLLHSHANTGVRLGDCNLCTIDCDTEAFRHWMLEHNPVLKRTLESRAVGSQLWFYALGKRPKKVCSLKVHKDSPLAAGARKEPDKAGMVQIGEFRAEGGQSVIRGIHPSGCHYIWSKPLPPVEIVFERLDWPPECALLWYEPRQVAYTGSSKAADSLLRRAIERVTIAQLWDHFGFPPRRANPVCSPFREDRYPSFSIYDQGRRFKDHGSSEHQGDSFDFYQLAAKQDAKTAFRPFVVLAGLGHELQSGENSRNSPGGKKDTTNYQEEASPAPVLPWPTMEEAAFYGLLSEMVQLIEPATEADSAALLVQLLASFGNAAGPGPYYVADGTRHYANLFGCLVGQSSRSRKGTSLSYALRFLQMADQDWYQEHHKSGISSGEGLIWKVRDPIFQPERNKERGTFEEVMVDPGIDDKRLLVTENEFARVLRVMDREGNTLSEVLRCAWDHRDLECMTKNSPAKATNPHISILGHITQEELKRELAECELFNGFANRFLWILVRRSKLLPHGGMVPARSYSVAGQEPSDRA